MPVNCPSYEVSPRHLNACQPRASWRPLGASGGCWPTSVCSCRMPSPLHSLLLLLLLLAAGAGAATAAATPAAAAAPGAVHTPAHEHACSVSSSLEEELSRLLNPKTPRLQTTAARVTGAAAASEAAGPVAATDTPLDDEANERGSLSTAARAETDTAGALVSEHPAAARMAENTQAPAISWAMQQASSTNARTLARKPTSVKIDAYACGHSDVDKSAPAFLNCMCSPGVCSSALVLYAPQECEQNTSSSAAVFSAVTRAFKRLSLLHPAVVFAKKLGQEGAPLDTSEASGEAEASRVEGEETKAFFFSENATEEDVKLQILKSARSSSPLQGYCVECVSTFAAATDVKPVPPAIQKAASQLPIIDIADPSWASLLNIFTESRPVAFFFGGSEPAIVEDFAFAEAAASWGGSVTFCSSPRPSSLQSRAIDYIGIREKRLPQVLIVSDIDDPKKTTKYICPNISTKQAITECLNAFKEGRLQPYYKSAEPPKIQRGPVYELVSSQFKAVVTSSPQEVLLLLYSPNCPHSATFMPIFEELAIRVAHEESLLLARMDGTKNEVAGLNVAAQTPEKEGEEQYGVYMHPTPSMPTHPQLCHCSRAYAAATESSMPFPASAVAGSGGTAQTVVL
ncbi:uncharacterized protein LOC34620455 [Cyclospora cayetanensis]|uniref:Uncharacterized protein LOC34620455 n=1 Tax=Cyclospora cayetanensis TaxID=88456 RepID=A0A6P6RRQ7_9EIME|nr:uncharacterized protein LOC34620455 [Cyclospora cayetanensis]